MLTMNIQDAKAHLSRLVTAAEQGEEVIIARNGLPVVTLQPVAKKRRKVVFDLFPMELSDEAIRESMAPLDDEELKNWGIL